MREALNTDKDGLGFPLDSDSDIIRFSNGGIGLKTDSQTAHNFMKIPFHDGHSLDVHNKAYTIACWAKWKQLPINVSNHNSNFICSYALDNNDSMNLYVYNGGTPVLNFQVKMAGGENARAATSASDLPMGDSGVQVNTWYYIVGTCQKATATTATLQLYVGTSSLAPVEQENGSTGYGESTGNQVPYYNWYVGKMSDHSVSTYYSSAMVDEFRIYNKVLSQAEIDKNWKHGKGKHK